MGFKIRFSSALLLILSFLLFFTCAQSPPARYCNGGPVKVQGEDVYANGQKFQDEGDIFYPNGARLIQSGDLVYPNNQRLIIAGDEYFMSGTRVLVTGDLYYPNRQRVQIDTQCFFQTGGPMNSCPDRVHYEEQSENIVITGWINRKTQKLEGLEFTLKELSLTTTWKIDKEGNISDIQSRCEDSLL